MYALCIHNHFTTVTSKLLSCWSDSHKHSGPICKTEDRSFGTESGKIGRSNQPIYQYGFENVAISPLLFKSSATAVCIKAYIFTVVQYKRSMGPQVYRIYKCTIFSTELSCQ